MCWSMGCVGDVVHEQERKRLTCFHSIGLRQLRGRRSGCSCEDHQIHSINLSTFVQLFTPNLTEPLYEQCTRKVVSTLR